MSASFLVRMKNRLFGKCLKTLERVKGIEPSYSAWKAADKLLSPLKSVLPTVKNPRKHCIRLARL